MHANISIVKCTHEHCIHSNYVAILCMYLYFETLSWQFFLLSVAVAYYTLSRKKNKKTFKTKDQIYRKGFRLWFLASTQNGIWSFKNMIRFLIHTLELKLCPLKCFPYVCTGKPCVCNVCRPRVTWWAELRSHMLVQGSHSHALAMFAAHALNEGRSYVNVTRVDHLELIDYTWN